MVLRGEVETRILAIIRERLQDDMPNGGNIEVHTPILGMGLGLDSIEALVLATEIEYEFDVVIEDDELTAEFFLSIAAMADHVTKKLSTMNDHGGTI